jgi:hypothetical protein
MSRVTLSRLSGLALILAFALSLAGGLLHPVLEHQSHTAITMGQPIFPLAHLLIFCGGALLLAGLPAAYARIAGQTGILGLLGFALYFLANATFIQFFTAYEALVVPTLAADPASHHLAEMSGAITAAPAFAALQAIGGMGYMLGLLLLGIAVARSSGFPRWAGVLMAIAPVLLLVPFPEQPILTGLIIELPRGLAVAAMGFTLLSHPGAPQQVAPDNVRPRHSAAD